MTAAIVADATDPAAYQVGAQSTATATVRDNDLPIVRPLLLTVDSTTINEGQRAGFNFRRIGDLSVRLEVPVSVTETGRLDPPWRFISGSAPTSLVFEAGDAEASVRVPTVDDDIDEANGGIEFLIRNFSPTAYRLQNNAQAITLPASTPTSMFATTTRAA